jgi:hypothetical protein
MQTSAKKTIQVQLGMLLILFATTVRAEEPMKRLSRSRLVSAQLVTKINVPPQLPKLKPKPIPKLSPTTTVLRWGEMLLKRAEAVGDYSCILVKRERINGKLGEHQYIYTKVRHRPFSVYLKILAPSSLKGREAVWVEGRNNGKLLAKDVGLKSILGTMRISPQGSFAMEGNLYPVTEIGILNLADKMVNTTKRDARISQLKVRFAKNTNVKDRSCTCIQIEHEIPNREIRYQLSRVYVDNELLLPIRFEGYTWPSRPGGPPILVEEYTYTNLKLNNGFTDRDFQL